MGSVAAMLDCGVMRIMVFRRVSLVAAVLLGMLVLLGAAPAAGASESARVSLDVAEPLTSVDDPVEITVRGFVDEIWVDAEIQVMVYGPGRPGDETGAEMVRSWPVNALEPQQLGVVQDLSLIHISEPTRLRRISYAVFCLKKKKKNKLKQNHKNKQKKKTTQQKIKKTNT